MKIELKLLLDESEMRRLRRSSAIAEVRFGAARSTRLLSTYYDTAGWLLWRNDLALRVRRDGRRWFQTLKGRGGEIGGPHQIKEFEWPLAGEALDPDLLVLTPYSALFARPRVRRELAPVFCMEVHRNCVELELGNGTRAELYFDRGEIRNAARSEAICEVGIHFISGDPGAILDFTLKLLEAVPFRIGVSSKAERGYALAAGKTPVPQRYAGTRLKKEQGTWSAFSTNVHRAARQVHANEAGFLRGRDPEYLHQMRVGLRRLRVALGLPRGESWGTASGPLRARLRELSLRLGEARNWDTFMIEMLRPMSFHFGAPVLAGMRARAARRRTEARVRPKAAVLDRDYARAWIELARLMSSSDQICAEMNSVDLREFADSALARRHSRLMNAGARSAGDKGLHALRLAAKKMRYTCDFFADLYPRKRVKQFLVSLVSAQDVLGEINDALVSQGLIESAAAGRSAVDARIKGLVQGWVAAGEARAKARVADVIKGIHEAPVFWKT